MNKFILTIIFGFFSLTSFILPQNKEVVKAVWVTTNYRLDWPSEVGDDEVQKEELEEIFNDLKSKGYNTIYFQVRSSGKVLFKSEVESFAPFFNGTENDTPGYDPAAYAVKLAHAKGLKIHAWVNTIRCHSNNGIKLIKDRRHLLNRHPGWVVEHMEGKNKSYWLDPGLPETRKYLTKLVKEIVTNYNFDGIQFDFIRYPGKNFNDDFSYYAYGKGKQKDDWRRENINNILTALNKTVKFIKPNMEVGATPIGIYKNFNGIYALQGYSDVYQDSRYWVKNNLVDYLVPQIYWGLKGKPDFKSVADNWLTNSNGVKIILGIGAFKPEVKKDLKTIFEFTLNSKASGYAIFRYGDIKNKAKQNHLRFR